MPCGKRAIFRVLCQAVSVMAKLRECIVLKLPNAIEQVKILLNSAIMQHQLVTTAVSYASPSVLSNQARHQQSSMQARISSLEQATFGTTHDKHSVVARLEALELVMLGAKQPKIGILQRLEKLEKAKGIFEKVPESEPTNADASIVVQARNVIDPLLTAVQSGDQNAVNECKSQLNNLRRLAPDPTAKQRRDCLRMHWQTTVKPFLLTHGMPVRH